MPRLILFFLFSLYVATAVAQNAVGQPPKRYPVVFAGAKLGEMLNIHPFFPEVSPSVNVEATLGWLSDGRKSWQGYYNYPEAGISMSFSFLGNQAIRGNTVTIFPYLCFSRKLGAHSDFELRPGLGLSFFNKPFDAFSNPTNYVIGSPVTAAATVYVGYKHYFDFWALSSGISFWHYSNGHVSVPNIGANTPYFGIGACYFVHGRPEAKEPFDTVIVDKKLRYNVTLSLGIQEVEGTVLPFDGPRYPVYSGSFGLSKRLTFKSRVRLGATYSYYPSFHDYIVSQEIYQTNITWYSSKLIAFVGHEFMFGNLSVLTDLGANLWYPLKKELINKGAATDRFAHKFITAEIGFNYYLKDVRETSKNSPFVGIGLRSIGGKADFVLLRTGFVF